MSMNSQNQNQNRYSLDTLASRADALRSQKYNGTTNGVVVTDVPVRTEERTTVRKPQWGGLTWFIIIALVVGFLLWLFRPAFVLTTDPNTGDRVLNWWLIILWAIVIALIIVFLLYLTRGAHGMFESTTTNYY